MLVHRLARPFAHQLAFWRELRRRSETTGAIAPSSRFLARAMTGPLSQRTESARILEIGPGTGAVTRRIVRLLKPEDTFDLVELNDGFADIIEQRFAEEDSFQRVAAQSTVHVIPVQEFQPQAPYDYIVSGLPLNNFSGPLVREILASYLRLLAAGGVLSYFEYIYIRSCRRIVSRGDERARLRELDEILGEFLAQYRFSTNWVLPNIPPAWVHHVKWNDEVRMTKDEGITKSE